MITQMFLVLVEFGTHFLYFGHDPNLISVLDGGFKKWLNRKKTCYSIKSLVLIKSNYIANENVLISNK